jgi:hypothetical protein
MRINGFALFIFSPLLFQMIRKGIPPPLRCAVWMSNIIQSTHPHEPLSYAKEYRTLAKVRVLDAGYGTLWKNNTLQQEDVRPMNFGNSTIIKVTKTYSGVNSLWRVLFALHNVLGVVEYAPLIPSIARILLSHMSESYVFTSIREMAHHSTWYWATSKAEHVAYQRAFLDILSKLHPKTFRSMKAEKCAEKYASAIFSDFFQTILPQETVWKIMDIYTLEGSKVLFRIGISLAVLNQREWKETRIGGSNSDRDWYANSLGSYTVFIEQMYRILSNLLALSFSLRFESLVLFGKNNLRPDILFKKSYGGHGQGRTLALQRERNQVMPFTESHSPLDPLFSLSLIMRSGVRRRYRFPRRPIIQRIIQIEDERYWAENQDSLSEIPSVNPLGLVMPSEQAMIEEKEPIPSLARSSLARNKLAEWLPLSLRFTKLDLVFSTNHHGRTLENFYRCTGNSKHTIMLVEPLNYPDVIVGCYASHNWHPDSKVYGDGSCFMFRIMLQEDADSSKESICWKWQYPNSTNLEAEDDEDHIVNNARAILQQYQVGTKDYISMGGNSYGGAGLRLNEDLTKGESSKATGFDNSPLAFDEMFEVGQVEVYQLVRAIDLVPIH